MKPLTHGTLSPASSVQPGTGFAVNNDDLDDFYEPNNAIITQNEPKKRATLTPP